MKGGPFQDILRVHRSPLRAIPRQGRPPKPTQPVQTNDVESRHDFPARVREETKLSKDTAPPSLHAGQKVGQTRAAVVGC
jgi:hypothetical protein